MAVSHIVVLRARPGTPSKTLREEFEAAFLGAAIPGKVEPCNSGGPLAYISIKEEDVPLVKALPQVSDLAPNRTMYLAGF